MIDYVHRHFDPPFEPQVPLFSTLIFLPLRIAHQLNKSTRDTYRQELLYLLVLEIAGLHDGGLRLRLPAHH